MDELARFNKARWEALAQANVAYSRPMLDLTPTSAKKVVDPEGAMIDVEGKNVLCLAGGGGQQSVAFNLLGAQVTVIDISETQLERDRQALAHYGFQAQIIQGDMRDLSQFAEDSFDLVWHAHAINFVPDTTPVFDGVTRILRPGGLYRLHFSNPFTMGLDESDWNGKGYPLYRPYADCELVFDDPDWDIWDEDGTHRRVAGPREFRHTMGTLINGLIGRGFTLLGIWEEDSGDLKAEPGTWEHMKAIAPPYLTIWAEKTGN